MSCRSVAFRNRVAPASTDAAAWVLAGQAPGGPSRARGASSVRGAGPGVLGGRVLPSPLPSPPPSPTPHSSLRGPPVLPSPHRDITSVCERGSERRQACPSTAQSRGRGPPRGGPGLGPHGSGRQWGPWRAPSGQRGPGRARRSWPALEGGARHLQGGVVSARASPAPTGPARPCRDAKPGSAEPPGAEPRLPLARPSGGVDPASEHLRGMVLPRLAMPSSPRRRTVQPREVGWGCLLLSADPEELV